MASNQLDFANIENFENLGSVKKIRKIIGDWWKIQLNFTDARGYLRGVSQGKFFNPKNPICKFIVDNNTTFQDCLTTARQKTLELQDIDDHLVATCHAGFSTLSVPLKVNGEYLGCVFADGFLIDKTADQQKKNIKSYLEKAFPEDAERLAEELDNLPVLSEQDVSNLKELLEVVIAEILSLQNTISKDKETINSIQSDLHAQWNFDHIVGKSTAMQDIFKILTKVSDSDATILITGENGVGKEGIAKAIHVNSKRKNQTFLIQNCGAINDNLLESELFGHVKGSFTDAIKDKKGIFEIADTGTLFLDEIGDTSPSMQMKLLRVLQEGTFISVGSTEQKKVDVRIIAATNKNLEQMVKEGTFREDLYYRLNVININVPSLRERKDDIPLLITHFLEEYAKINNVPIKKISPMCVQKMEQYDWPGNVRELQNEVERLCILSRGEPEIGAEQLSERIILRNNKFDSAIPTEGSLKDAIETLEKNMIANYLDIENGNKSRAAKKLGISRASLIMKCAKYGIGK